MPDRCAWCGTDPLYVAYHDTEWGVPNHDDRHLFEMLVLEGAQAGLSWITILRKRENYRRAFDDFDAERVARYGDADLARLLADAGIVRNRLKIESGGEQRARDAGGAGALRVAGCAAVALRRGFAAGGAAAQPGGDSGADRGVAGDEPRAQAAGFPLRGADGVLRLHAGGGDGERPRRGLLPPARDRGESLRYFTTPQALRRL